MTSTNWESVGLLVGFGLSIPVFFATAYGWVLWTTGPLVVRTGTPAPPWDAQTKAGLAPDQNRK